MKKILAITIAIAALLTTGCNSQKAEPDTAADIEAAYVIGIAQFAEHGSLDHCREGFLASLAEEGIIKGQNLTVIYENARTDDDNTDRIIDNFITQETDMICAIATPAAQSAYNTARKNGVPVIFTAVTDPIAAGLANFDGTPIGEITGTSDQLPVAQQLEMIRTMIPDAQIIGILYNTSEVNSISALEEYNDNAKDYGFTVVAQGISAAADVSQAADSLLGKVDCITNLTDNTVVSELPVILSKAGKLNIPVFGSEVDQVRLGCLAAVGLDYTKLGEQTGKMAAKVLKGKAKVSEMDFEVISAASFYGNNKVAKNLGIDIPEDLKATAAGLFDEIATNTKTGGKKMISRERNLCDDRVRSGWADYHGGYARPCRLMQSELEMMNPYRARRSEARPFGGRYGRNIGLRHSCIYSDDSNTLFNNNSPNSFRNRCEGLQDKHRRQRRIQGEVV